MNSKISMLLEIINKKEFSSIYINDEKTIFYLFGIRSSNAHFYISKNKMEYITDGRYIQAAKELFKNSEIDVVNIGDLENSIVSIFEKDLVKSVGIEYSKISLLNFNSLKNRSKKIVYHSIDYEIDCMRMVKSEEEIHTISEGVSAHEDIFQTLLTKIKIGMSELQLKTLFDCASLEVTPYGTSFETIVAFGENSALPHHHSCNRQLKKGDTILIDSGVNYKGYATDMTRTFFFDHVDKRLETAYKLVEEAVRIGEENVIIDQYTSNPHKSVVEYFKKENVEQYYLHSLGHGVGLDIHENPSLGLKEKDKFKPGVVFTIEPGLYYENIGGIRLENMYFISTQGLKKFNNLDYNIRVV